MSSLSQPPIHVIRVGNAKQEGQTLEAEPYLIVSTTSQYTWLYNDRGTGANMDVSIWRPLPADNTFSIVGDYAQNNYYDPAGTSLIVKAINDDPSNPLLKPPINYSEIWDDKGSGGTHDGSIWWPVPPDGYLSLGFVGQNGYSKPFIPNYACVRKDFCKDSVSGLLIWNDKGSGANKDVSIYKLEGVKGAFVAQSNYSPYVGPAHKLIFDA